LAEVSDSFSVEAAAGIELEEPDNHCVMNHFHEESSAVP
jgi:hypothetical protein